MRRSILFSDCIWESEGNQGRRWGGRLWFGRWGARKGVVSDTRSADPLCNAAAGKSNFVNNCYPDQAR